MHVKIKALYSMGVNHGILRFVNLMTFIGSLLVMTLLFERGPRVIDTPKLYDNLRDQLDDLKGIFPKQAGVSFDSYMLNVSLSNRIPLDRDLADERPLECISVKYTALPKATIIVPFHDESWSMLLRTATSIALRTPTSLIEEVILIDDGSTREYLGKPLEMYVALLPKFRLIRRPSREGLIRARLAGAAEARGSVLVFLDAHVEVTRGWLEPLLDAIKKNSSTVAVPHIDSINSDNIRYELWDPVAHGGFSWNMDYIWKVVPPQVELLRPSALSPVPTATTIGCAIAVDKSFFYKVGTFDEDLYIWGGENLELSFKAWMCGGSVRIYPCSRVGHLFRKFLPYSFPPRVDGQEVIYKNYQRVVDVWMDEYAKFYYANKPRYPFTKKELRSIAKRKKLRRDLKCQSFKWYLDTVIPEMFVPWENATYQGQIRNLGSWLCLSTDSKSAFIRAKQCVDHSPSQYFYFVDGLLMANSSHCLVMTSEGLKLLACRKELLTFHWNLTTGHSKLKKEMMHRERDRDVVMIKNHAKNDGNVTCITHVTFGDLQKGDLWPCADGEKFQYWSFTYKMNFAKRKHHNV